jgi:isopentenyldiphosphate isomerase
MEKPTFEYKVDNDSAWALYNHITLSLKDSHPATWMDDQTAVHEVFAHMLGLETEDTSILPEVDYKVESSETEPDVFIVEELEEVSIF